MSFDTPPIANISNVLMLITTFSIILVGYIPSRTAKNGSRVHKTELTSHNPLICNKRRVARIPCEHQAPLRARTASHVNHPCAGPGARTPRCMSYGRLPYDGQRDTRPCPLTPWRACCGVEHLSTSKHPEHGTIRAAKHCGQPKRNETLPALGNNLLPSAGITLGHRILNAL